MKKKTKLRGSSKMKETKLELFEAVMTGTLATVKSLVREGANVNALEQDGFTPLMFAIANGNRAITSYLLENGADVNLRNSIGQTALMLASLGGHKTIVEELLRAGADARAVDKENRNAMAWAASRGDFPEVLSLLFAFGTDPNGTDRQGITPLMRAALLGHVDSVAVLLTVGADDAAMVRGKSAYQMALEKGHNEVCRTMKAVLENVPRERWNK